MTITDNGTDLGVLAANDRRVARELAGAERDRIAAAQRIADADAATERRLREAEARLNLTGRRDEIKADRAARRATARETDRRGKRERKQARRQARAAWFDAKTAYVRNNAAAVLSATVYSQAVIGAVFGQVTAAIGHGLPALLGVSAAIAIEGVGLSMALTGHELRMARERALAPRVLVVAATALAMTINYFGHAGYTGKVLAALSLIGIVVWELRSAAKHRKTLRELGMLPDPPERFGWRRWLTYPRSTFAAWRLDVRDRLSPGAAALVERVERVAAERRTQSRAAQVSREATEAAKRRRALAGDVAKLARQAARTAARKGEAGPALTALMHLAHTGTPAPLLALPSPARAQADAARRALADAQARLQVEVEARENAQSAAARVEVEAAAVRAEAEVEVADARRRVEVEVARVRAEAEVEVGDARRRVEVEVAQRIAAESRVEVAQASFHSETQRRVEAERLAASTREQAEVEARRAAQLRGQAEAAGRGSETVQRQLADEQRQRMQAETQAGIAERLLAAEQQRIARVERQHEQATQAAQQQLQELVAQVADLRVQLAEAQAGPRRARRSPPAATVAEPVLLFHGLPVPVVPGAGPETVLKVLTAHEASPDVTHQALADEVGTSKRTVGAVLKAAKEQVTAEATRQQAPTATPQEPAATTSVRTGLVAAPVG